MTVIGWYISDDSERASDRSVIMYPENATYENIPVDVCPDTEKPMEAHAALHELPKADGSVPCPYGVGVCEVGCGSGSGGFDEE